MRRALCLTSLALALASCSGKGNTGRKEIDPALIAQVPWINGAPPLIDPATENAIVPPSPVYPPIRSGAPDPGSRVKFDTPEHVAQACAALDGITVSQWHHDFESPGKNPDTGEDYLPVAQFFSIFDDKSEGSWHVPGDAAWYSDIATKRNLALWGLAADQIENGPSCDGAPSKGVLHVRGGRFNYFGGGAEHPMDLDCRVGGQTGDICDHLVDVVKDGRSDMAVDASAFDGVAFWARRGPDGGSGLMVTLQDKYTSDRLARTFDAGGGVTSPGVGYCHRIKQCYPTCADGASCVPGHFGTDIGDVYRCIPEGASPKDAQMEPALVHQLYPPCGPSACMPPDFDKDYDYHHPDGSFTAECKPLNFTGLDENYWCIGQSPPTAADERCGDGFASNISLSTDWTFYKLPFDRFQQIGFAKRAPPSDVPQKSIYSLSFIFSVGYTDFYVDNLTFYRNK